ncbi:hypothetical protein IMG5_103650 [Ichthyophthirius multifiliis]|uniref:EF-hand domain-containing protein n=1 Tax=Ichthyophthirius multifiliis TaxID=5932 RepID=G0QSV4_ICHMU|nr:hypothetical protein IMG5_103650 [Ichthyophthirius multifiliis]EGR31721.1 hypothetical protein IMG5_103650 [Ichthyophthirius multifiliis]|eukprot:XP_004035207.1 hypothetical protein IMG5_103650 [Ichthyophthirius multifiliis]
MQTNNQLQTIKIKKILLKELQNKQKQNKNNYININIQQNFPNNYQTFQTKIQQLPYQSFQSSNIVGPSTIRSLTVRQLKETIEEIYKSKQSFDKKYQEAQLPRETMEQHMYTYLNQKYGLKNLIIEWAAALINGIRKFSSEDNDVAVFGKILRNECDEEFRFVQNQVKNTIQELLKMYLRGKYSYKHANDIKDMLNQKINGWICEEETIDIIKYMYNQEDAESLIEKQKGFYVYGKNATLAERKKMTREEYLGYQQEKEKARIEFTVFQKIILDFQLKSHEKFLRKFIQLYRSVDQDQNGIINENEFRDLLIKMGIEKDETEIQKMLSQVDAYNKQQITFSQCVTLFSSELIVCDGGNQMSILQKIQV